MAIAMMIEFLGNSGAGKSTLIPILKQLLRDDGLAAMSALEAIHHYMRKTYAGRLICLLAPRALQGPILWRFFSYFTSNLSAAVFALENPRLISYVVRSQLSRQIPWRHRRLILRLFFQMTGWYRFLKSRSKPGEVLLFDEGFVHRATHIFVSESECLDPDHIAAYLSLLPRSDLVVRIQAPLDTCLARVYARGLQIRLRNLEAPEIEQFMANAERVVDITAQYLENSGWETIKVKNDGDLEASATDLRQQLTRHFPNPSNMASQTC
jgi:thymidylate kinase